MSTFYVGFGLSVISIWVIWYGSYALFDRTFPSRRERPPKAPFDLVPIGISNESIDKGSGGVDIIFVHGLGSQPDTTWCAAKAILTTTPAARPSAWSSIFRKLSTAPPNQFVAWVEDFLPCDLAEQGFKNINMFYYNYDSAYHRDASEKRLKDLGNQLLSRITSETQRSKVDRKRGVIFVAHSYGGLVVKQALVQSKMSQNINEYSLAANMRGIIFLGAPHNGSTMSLWVVRCVKLLAFLGSNSALLAGLIPGCDLLKDLHQDFISAMGDRLYIVNFFEEIKTRLFKSLWFQKDEYIVNQDSATFFIPHIINDSLRTDHSGLNKYNSRDSNYYNITRRLFFILSNPTRTSLPQRRENPGFELDFEPIHEVANDFIGRKSELRQLEVYFNGARDQRGHAVVLHGLGGIGKTQLAAAYFNNLQHDYSARFHVDGRDQASFFDDFLKIANAAGLEQDRESPVEKLIENVWRWLNSKYNDRWLILLDNVDNPGTGPEAFDLNIFLRHFRQGSLMITTRVKNLIINGKHLSLEVKAFDQTYSLCVLENNARRPLSHESDCGILLQLLAGVPLALVQAGIFLWNTNCSITTYIEAWNSAWDLLSKDSGRPSNYQERTMATTWQVSYNRLLKKNLNAANLLTFWICLDNRGLEHETVRDSKCHFEAPTSLMEMATAKPVFLEAIGDLMENSFVISTDRDKWSLHNVLHKWLYSCLNTAIDKEILQWAIICVGSKAEKQGSTNYWDTSSSLSAHASRCMDLAAATNFIFPIGPVEAWRKCLLGLSRLCIAHGTHLENAERALLLAITGERSNAIVSVNPISMLDSETSLRAMNTLGNMHRTRCSYLQAAKTYKGLIMILQQSRRGAKHWIRDVCENYVMVANLDGLKGSALDDSGFTLATKDILNLMRSIRTAYKLLEENNLTEAIVIFDQLRAAVKLMPDDKQSIKVWKDGALCYARRADFGMASKIFEEVLTVAQKSKGGYKNPLTLDILNNYGIICRKLGQLENAERLLGAAVEGLSSRRGRADCLYLNAAENLGNVMLERGLIDRARRIFELCLVEALEHSPQRAPHIQYQISSI